MATQILSQFDGGHAESIRSVFSNECEFSSNFDTWTDPKKLSPFIDTVAEVMSSGTTTDYALTDVNAITVSGTTSLVALGRTALVTNTPAFYRKASASDISSAWQFYASGVNNVVPQSLVVVKSTASADAFAYCLGNTGSAYNLQKFDGVSAVATMGVLGGYDSGIVARPFVHPEEGGVIYMVAGNIISKYNANTATFTATAFTLPSNMIGVSLTYYGTYLVIVCRPKNGVGDSMMYFWGRDTSLNTLQESISIGASQVNIVENLENQLYVITSGLIVGQYSNILKNKLTARVYTGTSLKVVKELTLSSTFGTSLNNFKIKKADKVYFGLSNDTSLYVFGMNKEGRYFLGHDRALPSGTTTVTGISIIGDFFFVGFNTTIQNNQFNRTISESESQSYNTTSTWRTTINPKMPEGDRMVNKNLMSVMVVLSCATSTGTSNMKYSVDGSTFTTMQTFSNVQGIQVMESTRDVNDMEFVAGREYQFEINTTGNASIIGILYRYQPLGQIT